MVYLIEAFAFLILTYVLIYLFNKNNSAFLNILIINLGIMPIIFQLLMPRKLTDGYYDGYSFWTGLSKMNQLFLVFLCFMAIFIYSVFKKNKSLKGILLWISYLGIFLAGLLTCIFGIVPEFELYILYFPLAVTVLFVSGNNDYYITFVRMVSAILATYVIISFIMMLFAPNWAFTNYDASMIPFIDLRFNGILSHANSIAPMVLLYIFIVKDEHVSKNILTRITIVLSYIMLFLSQSKTAWFTLLIIIIYNYIRERKKATQYKFLLPAIIFISIIAMTFLLNENTNSLNNITLTGRTSIWKISLDIWQQNPLFGYGNSVFNEEHRQQIMGFSAIHALGQAHNQFIQAVVQMGILGGVFVILYIVSLYRHSKMIDKVTKGVSVNLFLLIFIRMFAETPLRNFVLDNGFFMHFVIFGYILFSYRYYNQRLEQIVDNNSMLEINSNNLDKY